MWRLRPPDAFTHCTRAMNGGPGCGVAGLVDGLAGVPVGDDVDTTAGAGVEAAAPDEQPATAARATYTGAAKAARASRERGGPVMPAIIANVRHHHVGPDLKAWP